MPSALEAAALAWRQRLLDQERAPMVQLLRVYEESWQRLEAEIAGYTQRLEAGDPLRPGLLHRRAAAEDVQRAIEAEIQRLTRAAEVEAVSLQRQAVNQAFRSVQEMAAVQDAQVAAFLRRPSFVAVEALVGYASDGSPLRDVLESASRGQAEAMAQLLASNVGLGVNPMVTAKQMEQQFGALLSRARTIARSETLRAYRTASQMTMQANEDVLDGWIRIEACDDRTCAACWALHGTVYRLREAAVAHPNCVVEGTIVASPEVLATSKRWFAGEVIEIVTREGHRLTVTPNHPVLTPQGWISAGLLVEGDDVISSADPKAVVSAITPDNYNSPTLIEEIVETFGGAPGVAPVSVPTAPEDFHGDGAYGYVGIVGTNCGLESDVETPFLKQLGKAPLLLGGMRLHALFPEGALDQVGFGLLGPTDGGVGNLGASGVFVRGGLVGPKAIRLGVPPDSNAPFGKPALDNVVLNAQACSDGFHRFAGHVSANDGFIVKSETLSSPRNIAPFEFAEQSGATYLPVGSCGSVIPADKVLVDRVLEVRRRYYSGHVYNLQTVAGWYIAEGILTHNCRMVMAPHVTNAPITVTTGAERFGKLSAEKQRLILGPKMFDAYNSGQIALGDIVAYSSNDRWGPSIGVRSARSLAQAAEQ